VQLDLDFNQIKQLVDQLGSEERKTLTEYLEKKELASEIREFRKRNRNIPITLEEITEEVETVRKERFERERRH
jgi:hypothetical protein